jgi:iron complex outermembrane recepter protein
MYKTLTLALASALATMAHADTLAPILVSDTVNINPNIVEPQRYSRAPAISADGADYLRQINGVNISRFGGRGLELIVRGQSQTRLNVLLDGAYVHGGCPNRMDPPASWAALNTYEQVQVIKGVQTLQYGGAVVGRRYCLNVTPACWHKTKGCMGDSPLLGVPTAVSKRWQM